MFLQKGLYGCLRSTAPSHPSPAYVSVIPTFLNNHLKVFFPSLNHEHNPSDAHLNFIANANI